MHYLSRFRTLLGVLVAALAVGVFIGATFFEKTIVVREGTPNTPAAMSSVNLMIDYGNGTIRTWNTVSWHEAMSVMDLIAMIASAREITLLTKESGNKVITVESIDGTRSDSAARLRWQYWVNNTYEPRAAGKYYLKPGDIVLWKYVREQFE
jgi:hypothetical protein